MREIWFGISAIGVAIFMIGLVLLWGSLLQRRGRTSVGSSRAYAKTLEAEGESTPRLYDPESTASWLLTAEPVQRVVEPAPRRLALPVAPKPAEQPTLNALSNWSGEDTGSFTILEEYEAELVDVNIEEADAAEAAFWADPLGSWVLPPDEHVAAFLPEADHVFRNMVDMGRLTGVGMDIDTEWEAWNLATV